MEERGRGSRGGEEEGTYRNKFPVPASGTLSERRREKRRGRDREVKNRSRHSATTVEELDKRQEG